ncbi:glycine cleavage system protein GcvH [Thioalkalivibrio sp.]|uniref:glycine cleavage system protein GcvH n=1 Tax=Thioalkalivibrio sp. TaxID=2093813 RepID=UPI0012D4D55E|nr:glycine cleavage system protein GcvH [Thioalkalivibrio sp.]TVP76734.1 MAG: glycine cleavage system protein GcvH [Thioalkalivibrio sp.]
MTDTRQDLKYTKSHEWVRVEADGSVTVGITDHAQALLGDLVFVETPEAGTEATAGEACATVESVKAASDVYAPVSGEIAEANEDLADAPEKVNESPFDQGWLFRIRPSDASELDALMDAEEYAAMVASET